MPPLRQALIARGHTITSAPWNGKDQSPFYDADLVVLRSCWDYHKAPKLFLAWLDQLKQRNVPVRNPIPLVKWNFDKSYLLELSQAGFNVPATRLVDPRNHAEILSLMKTLGWERAVRKPISGQSGFHVDLLTQDSFDTWPPSEMPTERALLQAFQSDVSELGETLLMFFNGKFSYAVRRILHNGEWLSNSKNGSSRKQVTVSADIVRQAEQLLAYLPETPLYARVDGLVRGDTLLIMELELIEPSFAFEVAPEKAAAFVTVIEQEL